MVFSGCELDEEVTALSLLEHTFGSCGFDVFRNFPLEAEFAVVLWFIADDPAGTGNAPEAVRVTADSVKDLEGDTILIANVGRFDALYKELGEVAGTDICAQCAPHTR